MRKVPRRPAMGARAGTGYRTISVWMGFGDDLLWLSIYARSARIRPLQWQRLWGYRRRACGRERMSERARPAAFLFLILSLLLQVSAIVLGKIAALHMAIPGLQAFLTNPWYLASL